MARLLIAIAIALVVLVPTPTRVAAATTAFDGFCTVTGGTGGMVLRLSGYNVIAACNQMAKLAGKGYTVRRETTPRSPGLFCIRRHNAQLVYVWVPAGYPLALTREACAAL